MLEFIKPVEKLSFDPLLTLTSIERRDRAFTCIGESKRGKEVIEAGFPSESQFPYILLGLEQTVGSDTKFTSGIEFHPMDNEDDVILSEIKILRSKGTPSVLTYLHTKEVVDDNPLFLIYGKGKIDTIRPALVEARELIPRLTDDDPIEQYKQLLPNEWQMLGDQIFRVKKQGNIVTVEIFHSSVMPFAIEESTEATAQPLLHTVTFPDAYASLVDPEREMKKFLSDTEFDNQGIPQNVPRFVQMLREKVAHWGFSTQVTNIADLRNKISSTTRDISHFR